jgi:hypothetical protein
VYLVPLKSAVVEAIRAHFNAVYLEEDFRNIWISVEYPREQVNYPGVWVNYQDAGELEKAGIDHREYVQDDAGEVHEVTRWRFTGAVSFTCAALSSFERDRLFDEVVRMIAFAGMEGRNSSVFRTGLESNDFIAMNGNFDVISPSGEAASPGSPWGGDEIIYEKTLSFDVIGEFVSDPATNTLAVLSDVQTMGFRQGTPPPAFPDALNPDPNAPEWNPHVWP